jgi:hypothetical protein
MQVKVVKVNLFKIPDASGWPARSKNDVQRPERFTGGVLVLEVVPVQSEPAVSRINPSDPLTDRGGVDDPAQLGRGDGWTRELFEHPWRRQ